MKNLQILITCCFLVLLTACGREGGGTAQTPVASEEITESITQMPDEQESEAMPENIEIGDHSERRLLSDSGFFEAVNRGWVENQRADTLFPGAVCG